MRMDRLGGRRSEKKIPVKDIDGHVQSRRTGLTEEDLKYRKKPEKRKEVAKAGGDLRYAPIVALDEQADDPIKEVVNLENPLGPLPWRDTVLPGDFVSFNYTPLEEDTRALDCVDDTWLQERGSTPTRFVCNTVPSAHPTEIDGWLQDQHPKLHVSIATDVRNKI